LLFRGTGGRHDDPRALLLADARRLAAELAQVEQLGATDATTTDDDDVRDHRAMHGEDALDAHAVGDLPDREAFADSAAAASDAHAFERLDALLVAFLDAHVHAQSVARAECRQVTAQPGFLSFDEGMHSLLRAMPRN